MVANKHTIYLTKNHKLTDGALKNVFMFNENGPAVRAKWVKKNLEINDGVFVVLDHNNSIFHEVERVLTKNRYYIEHVDFSNKETMVHINPYDFVSNTSEIHFMFLSFLYAMWDNYDEDLQAMSNLIDAFASTIFFMFKDVPSKKNMITLRKLVGSVRTNYKDENGNIAMMSDGIFDSMQDQESMPCKYYRQFIKAAGERKKEIAEKVAIFFDMFTDMDMEMMKETEESVLQSLSFRTAFFANVNNEQEEHSAKILITLLNYMIQRAELHAQTLFVIDDLDPKNNIICLPYWMKEGSEYNITYLVINDKIAEFKETARTEKYFRSLQKSVAASILVCLNDNAVKYSNELPSTMDEMDNFTAQDCVATVLIHLDDTNDQDELL